MAEPTVRRRNPVLARLVFRLKVLGGIALVLLVIALGVYQFAPQWALRGVIAWETLQDGLHQRALQVGDTRWVYLEGGKQDAPTLVLLHGYGGSYADWLLTARYLTGNFRLIIPDLPGWGASTRIPGAKYGYPAQVARLHAFLAALDPGPIVLAGHSMGGAIAGLYAAAYPQQVRALALIDSAGVPFKENAFVRELKAGRNPFDINNRAQFRQLAHLLFAKPPKVPPRIEDVFVDQSIRNRTFRDKVLREITAPDERDALEPKLADITAPTLTLWCIDDRVIDVSALNTIRKGLTHVSTISSAELTGCGHMSIMEKPRQVADIITRFALLPPGA